MYHCTKWCVSHSERWLSPLDKSHQKTLCQLCDNITKFSPVTNTCVHKPVASHISLCTPCVYVLACILHMFLGTGGYNSVWHRTASDIGTAALLRTDPRLGQTTSKLINPLLSSKQPCVLETQMMQDVRVSTQRYQEVNCPRMWCCVIGQTTFSSITVLLSSGPGISSWPVQPLKMKATWSFTMLGTIRPMTVSNLRRPESSAMNPTVTISWDMHQNH